jgi:hypothetical protein
MNYLILKLYRSCKLKLTLTLLVPVSHNNPDLPIFGQILVKINEYQLSLLHSETIFYNDRFEKLLDINTSAIPARIAFPGCLFPFPPPDGEAHKYFLR